MGNPLATIDSDVRIEAIDLLGPGLVDDLAKKLERACGTLRSDPQGNVAI